MVTCLCLRNCFEFISFLLRGEVLNSDLEFPGALSNPVT